MSSRENNSWGPRSLLDGRVSFPKAPMLGGVGAMSGGTLYFWLVMGLPGGLSSNRPYSDAILRFCSKVCSACGRLHRVESDGALTPRQRLCWAQATWTGAH